jgi:hypothetical protein
VLYKFGLSDLYLVLFAWFLVLRLTQFLWSRWKTAKRERQAETWPVLAGKVSSVNAGLWPPTPVRLVVTYKSTAGEYLIDSWTRDFASKSEAVHAKRALTGWECPVRYNPAYPEQTTLLWTDVKARLASVPYVLEIKPLRRGAYRIATGFAVAGLGGLAACLAIYGMAMANTSVCLCNAEIFLLAASVVLFLVGMGMWGKLAEAVPPAWFPIRMWRVMDGWERWLLGAALVAMVVSVAHFLPMWRAIPMNGDVPDKAMAGVLLAMVMPVYLMCGLAALKTLRLRKPVVEAAGSAALA